MHNPNMSVKKQVHMWHKNVHILCSKPNNFFLGPLNPDATQQKCSLNHTASYLPHIHLHWTSPLKVTLRSGHPISATTNATDLWLKK